MHNLRFLGFEPQTSGRRNINEPLVKPLDQGASTIHVYLIFKCILEYFIINIFIKKLIKTNYIHVKYFRVFFKPNLMNI